MSSLTLRASTAYIIKLSKPILFASMVALPIALTACNQPTQVDTTKSSTEAKSSNETNSSATDKTDSNIDTTMSLITLDTAIQAVTIPIKSSGEFDEKTVKCVEDIQPDFAVDDVQTFYESKLTPEEMTQLNEFYASKLGKTFTQYGRDEFLISLGHPVQSPAPKPTEAQINEMIAFTQTPVGIKYGKLNLEQGEGSLNELVTELMTEELSKCEVKL